MATFFASTSHVHLVSDMLELSIRDASFLIRPASSGDGGSVLINRNTKGKSHFVDAFSFSTVARLETEVFLEKMILFAVFGTYLSPSNVRYLVVGTDAEVSASIHAIHGEVLEGEGEIFRLLRAELVPYISNAGIVVGDTEARHIGALEKLLSSGTFYFTKIGDGRGKAGLLKRCQKRTQRDITESEFVWNHQLAVHFGDSLVRAQALSPLMQGFAMTRSMTEDGVEYCVTVISRRSVKQAGTRYNARGIDDEGSVAIFAETECIVTCGNFEVFSFVQVRGSVPVFWSQSNSSNTVELTRNGDMTKAAFRRHYARLSERYGGPVVFVNLLSATKGGECMLSRALWNQVGSLTDEEGQKLEALPVLIEFDFHNFVNASQSLEESLISLMDTLRPHIYHTSYFGVSHTQDVTSLQTGIIRINCLDCLDRTNAVEMQIAWEALMMAKLESVPKSSSELKQIFTDVWVENGDVISKGYSGTGSVLSRLVRTAGSGNQIATILEHSWRSANRFIAANWDDAERHSAICHLLRLEAPPSRFGTHYSVPDLSVWVGTWNLNGNRVNEDVRWMNEASDIIIMGFQETIDLTTVNVLLATRGDEPRNRALDSQILQQLAQVDPFSSYVQVASESLVGLYIAVFVKQSLAEFIDSVKTNRFKAGFGGTTGNKGAVSVSFRLKKSIDFQCLNVHLDSGEFRNEERMRQLEDILSSQSLLDETNTRNKNPTAVFVCGDFNFRCDGIDGELAREFARKDRLEKLKRYDPFLTVAGNVLKAAEFREMPILFPPTYKYESSGELNEKRVPSWCDRIFFRLRSGTDLDINPLTYLSVPGLNFSDHKPVFATFLLSSALRERSQPDLDSPVLAIAEPPPIIDLISGDSDEMIDPTSPDLLS